MMAPRLHADEMLAGLCRWLRAAGLDCTQAAPGTDDARVLEAARADDRLLLTRDRALAGQARRSGARVLLVEGDTLEAQARELAMRLGIDWLYRPMSRCLRCNVPIRPAPCSLRKSLPFALREDEPLWYCPSCGRPYWAGSHVRRMMRRLRDWAGVAGRNGLEDMGTPDQGAGVSAQKGTHNAEDEPDNG